MKILFLFLNKTIGYVFNKLNSLFNNEVGNIILNYLEFVIRFL